MTRSELQDILHEMVEKKCDEGFERMKDMPICEKFYTDMAKQGWNEQANTFKSIVLYTTILHPEWTDKEIFLEFANNMRKLYKQGMATLQPNRIINIKKIMKKEITREQRIEMARTQTEKVATMKDWRITNKYNRMQREAARRMMEKGGFAEMTQAEAHAIEADIPEYVDEVKYDADGNAYVKKERSDKEVKIWGYMWNSVWKEIQLTAF